MLKHLQLLLTAVLFGLATCSTLASSTANDEGLCIGYCNSSIATKSSGTITGKPGNSAVIEAAIFVPKSQWLSFAECKITKVRVGIPNTEQLPDTLKGFLRYQLDGENVASGIVVNPHTGWVEITLDTPYVIRGNEDLYIGYGFFQESKLACISFVGETNANACFVGKNGSWADYSSRTLGSLSIEAFVEGEQLPLYNLSLLTIGLNKAKYHTDSTIVVSGSIRNAATQTLEAVKFAYDINGEHPDTATITQTLAYRDIKNFSFEISTLGLPANTDYNLHLKLILDNDQDDEEMTDNLATLPFILYDQSYPRKVVLEEFTTELCSYCPSGAAKIKESLASSYADNVIWICHHAGFYTDWLTISDSEKYTWFYGPTQTFAPAIMFNRTLKPSFTANGFPINNIPEAAQIKNVYQEELEDVAFVDVHVQSEIDIDTKQITINVDCDKMAAFDADCAMPSITVMLIEDSIKAMAQANGGSDYVHEGVLRRVLTDTWGDDFSFTGNHFTTSYEVAAVNTWNVAHLKAVAFVNNFDADNRNNCRIYNAAVCPVTQTSAIDLTTSGKIVSNIRLTDLCGNVLEQAPATGVFIKHITYTDGTTETSKTIQH